MLAGSTGEAGRRRRSKPLLGALATSIAAAVAMLPAGAQAEVVTPQVVKPQVVTPQLTSPTPTPDPAAPVDPGPVAKPAAPTPIQPEPSVAPAQGPPSRPASIPAADKVGSAGCLDITDRCRGRKAREVIQNYDDEIAFQTWLDKVYPWFQIWSRFIGTYPWAKPLPPVTPPNQQGDGSAAASDDDSSEAVDSTNPDGFAATGSPSVGAASEEIGSAFGEAAAAASKLLEELVLKPN